MQRRHRMPFGAEVLDDGSVRFRLWAPSAKTVGLCLGDATEPCLRLGPEGNGWFSLVTARAHAGTRYRFAIDDGLRVPDPASRFQPEDVNGPSEVIAPAAFVWRDGEWRGRPWAETVLYELHVGSFSPEGNFAGVKKRLDYLRDLGVTAIELMPLADFPGRRNWGYDGVLPFAPDSAYGRPDDLKDLIQTAHEKGLMMFLDVVYNHFGPEGNYLHAYAKTFFTDRHSTPWGAAINFDGEGSATVREFYIHNALYWLNEYHFDGLRFDAVHAIHDDSHPDILEELAHTVSAAAGAQRQVHLVLENDDNEARYLTGAYRAQWNDDIHHALHVIGSGESGGYYADYADAPLRHLGRCLTQGFAYQGDPSAFRNGATRGEPSAHVPITAFVSFLQNHDQIGNRAFGERITAIAKHEAVRALTAVFLLAPSPPMLFMGEEWGTQQPFPFFCDFDAELGRAVTEGRRKEFARFPEFADEGARDRIPDPNSVETFQSAVLDWSALARDDSEQWLAFHRKLLAIRAREIVPRLSNVPVGNGEYETFGDRGLSVRWALSDNSRLILIANLGDVSRPYGGGIPGRLLFQIAEIVDESLPPWSVFWFLDTRSA